MLRGMNQTTIKNRQIRAQFNSDTIRVYQAYSSPIALSALHHGRFVSPPFKMERMTWIKPSFLWMMYRAGWGHKDDGQKTILAIDIRRQGFEWALAHSCLSHPPAGVSAEEWATIKADNPVRIQWDPERDLHLQPLDYRAIQVGLSGEAVSLYTGQWIHQITDISEQALAIESLVKQGKLTEAKALLPVEYEYPVHAEIARRLEMT